MLSDRYLHGIPSDSRIRTDGRFLTESRLTPERMSQIERLNEVAKRRGQTLAQMALSWVLKDKTVTSVLIGASKPSQIVENIHAASGAPFSNEELKEIDEISLS